MTAIDQILDKLARDVEASIHAFYRGDVRQHTQRVKSDTFLREARQALAPHLGQGGSTTVSTPPSSTPGTAGVTLTPDELSAVTRCVMGWMPLGAPNTAAADSRCVPGAKEMAPTWGEREKARLALRKA